MKEPRTAGLFFYENLKNDVNMLGHPSVTLKSPRWIAVGVWLTCAAVYIALVISLGRDINWDYLNYHDYLALTSTGGRFDQDFFAAGLQGHQNPLAYWPLEILLRNGASSVQIGIGLALLHSINALILALICLALGASMGIAGRRVMVPGLLLGLSSPILLTHLGSTFIDPIVSIPVLAGVLLFIRSDQPRQMALAALIVGIATGLKLTNVAFAIGLGLAMALCHRRPLRQWLADLSGAAVSMMLGLGLAYGAWGWKLHAHFGNPFFPLLNGVFQSPMFPPFGGNIVRFIPQTPQDLLAFPFRLLQHNSWIYVEVVTPDLLPAAVTLLAALAGLLALLRRTERNAPVHAGVTAPIFRLGVFIALSTLAWLATSANGRYAIVLFMLLGPFAAALFAQVAPARTAYVACWVLLVLQWFNTYTAGIERWGSQQWTASWLKVDMPAQHRATPGTYLALDGQSQSYLTRYLHPDSSYINLIGSHYSIPSEGAGVERVETLLARHPGRTFAVFKDFALPGLKPSIRYMVEQKSQLLDRVGLALDADACEVAVATGGRVIETGWAGKVNEKLLPARQLGLYICALRPVEPSAVLAQRRALASQIMTSLERHCPDLFFPPAPQTEGLAHQWYRSYTKYDNLIVSVHLDDGSVRYWLTGQGAVKVIGRLPTWKADLARFECTLPQDGRRGVASIQDIRNLGPL